jgi:L-threonylcarbamoyladenylate synthase
MDGVEALDAAERELREDHVIVVPTDTVYGLAALPQSTRAREKLYRLKARPDSMPIAVLVASADQAALLAATVPPAARRLMEAFWPGPLTLVLAARDGGEGATVGVRCPDHDFVRALTERVGPVAVTSANRHGQRTATGAAAAAGSLAGEVALVIDGGPCDGIASTVVDTTEPDLPLLREGSIRREQVVEVALR